MPASYDINPLASAFHTRCATKHLQSHVRCQTNPPQSAVSAAHCAVAPLVAHPLYSLYQTNSVQPPRRRIGNPTVHTFAAHTQWKLRFKPSFFWRSPRVRVCHTYAGQELRFKPSSSHRQDCSSSRGTDAAVRRSAVPGSPSPEIAKRTQPPAPRPQSPRTLPCDRSRRPRSCSRRPRAPNEPSRPSRDRSRPSAAMTSQCQAPRPQSPNTSTAKR
jgi:hypothetical protein